jgi:hypothetical protein
MLVGMALLARAVTVIHTNNKDIGFAWDLIPFNTNAYIIVDIYEKYMSTKKEAEKTGVQTDDDKIRKEATSTSPWASLAEQHHLVDKALDETRDNIRRTTDEARRDIPRNTQALNDYQEQAIQATREITDSYLESQKEIIKSFQSTWVPYVENSYGVFWNNWVSPRRAAEIYTRTVSNFADNVISTTRLANNAMFANIEAFKTFVQREKDDVKEFSRIGVNTAKTFEQTSKDVARQQGSGRYS